MLISRTTQIAIVVLALLLIGQAFAKEDPAAANLYRAELVSLVDSDTYRMRVALWPGLLQRVDVRLAGIDTPEWFRPSKACRKHERDLAKRARAVAATALKNAHAVLLADVRLGKYAGRVVADVILADARGRQTRLAEILTASGLAVEYHGGTKVTDWCLVDP